ncbi:hypothetical protein SARC_09631 [Sphaeroforma arctica JP610]|uniref:Uncharacterized protein n=1 Tax=Sphaeroforma arctica JP610 TaxID=667725 RepID=A0A0L0FPM0_9EUKA|nr:hypothetical protein SARC_09631 [Sphaeroforma arctica JP610]KNC77918.1 hypothetical protein SARC_09631 [Sphaeroforma arctica JP610]|eukprot:XP_014151820.1 hypothetical protein SARC_09631 [Sphaeroforma arctica JP610]
MLLKIFALVMVACCTTTHACEDKSALTRINDEWKLVIWGKQITGDDAAELTYAAIIDAVGGGGTFTYTKLKDILGDQ